ncbi:MAG: hypothetical protein EAZ55_03665 [Cytophagales bacterium]|nr:MAG: hypothetical protein EAZ55_03665 [Cytophagales bacterium]
MLKYIFIFLCFLFLTTFTCKVRGQINDESVNVQNPTLRKGTIDLRQYDFEQNPTIDLNGEWEFYWKQLLNPRDFAKYPLPKDKDYLKVPVEWSNAQKKGVTTIGYATYRIRILLPKNQENLSLQLPTIGTAYQLWANDTLIAKRGTVGREVHSSFPEYVNQIVSIPAHQQEVQLVMQVSNHNFFRGGIFLKVILGKKDFLTARYDNLVDMELFLIGCLFFMTIYHLILYLSRRSDIAPLFLSFILISIIIRFLITNGGAQYWQHHFPDTSFELLMKLEYIGLYAYIPMSILFISNFFPTETPYPIANIFHAIGIVLVGITIVTPATIFPHFLVVMYLKLLLGYIFMVYILIKAALRRRLGANIMLLGMVILLISAIPEILHDLSIIHLPYFNLSSIGMLVFLFCQSIVISVRFSRAFVQVAQLSNNLEQMVEERTKRIEKQKRIIEAKNESILESIYYAQTIQEAILPTEDELNNIFKNYFVFFQPRDIIGGDFYYAQQYEDKIFIIVADATGHGVPGAMMSMIGNTMLNEIIVQKRIEMPHLILEKLHQNIQEALKQEGNQNKDGMDVAAITIHLQTQTLYFAGAKRPLIISQQGNLLKIEGDKISVGGYHLKAKDQETLFKLHQHNYQTSDLLYIFTDGYADQFGGEDDKKFLSTRLYNLLKKMATLPMQEQKQMLISHFEDWRGYQQQTDDVLVVGVQLHF